MALLMILAGPTASGKSDAAERLARRVGGDIVNADAMQVYGALRVLTARPGEGAGAALSHLYGHVGRDERYSAGRYLAEAGDAVARVRAAGRVPIVAGGTGLYLRALTEGLSAVPEVPAAVEAEAAARFARDPAAARAALIADDPDAGRLAPGDRQRHVRRMAVLAATGRTLSDWQAARAVPPVPGPVRAAVLCPPRPALYARIDARAARDFAAGTEEVRALLADGGLPDGPLGRALGVRPIAAMLRGEMGEAEALTRMRRDTRRYAKRQMTWLRVRTQWPWFETADAATAYLAAGAAGVTDSSA